MNIFLKKSFLIVLLIFPSWFAVAKEFTDETLPKIGNLALRTSQRPIPLFSFAQFILNKGDLQIFSYFDAIRGTDGKFTDLMITPVWGVTDRLSVLLNFVFDITARCRKSAIAATNTEVTQQSSTSGTDIAGLSNMFVQLEYAFYLKFHQESYDRATFVFNMSVPPGHLITALPADVVTPSFFFGLTASHLDIDWYYYISDAFIITTPYLGVTRGTTILYQGGVGRNIYHFENFILTAMVEGNGVFSRPDRLCGVADPNSGGNLIQLGPSLFFSSNNFIAQLGIQFVPYQKVNGDQPKESFWVSCGLAYTF